MDSDLRELKRAFGLDSKTWIGRYINVYTLKEKDFMRWKISPRDSAVE